MRRNTFCIQGELRCKMITHIFQSGYAGPDDMLTQPIRWTMNEMHELCDDEGLLSLFQRYTTLGSYGKNIEDEVKAQIAINKMLEDL